MGQCAEKQTRPLFRQARIAMALSFVLGQASVTFSQGRSNEPAPPVTLTEFDKKHHGYRMSWGDGQAIMFEANRIEVTPSGEASLASSSRSVGPGSLDFSPSFASHRYMFSGSIKEFVCNFNDSAMIISAVHRNYDASSPDTSPTLAEAGVVEIDSHGFVTKGNAKSGWVNMPANFTLRTGMEASLVRLIGVTLWVADGGRTWLSFNVNGATADGRDLAVKTSVTGSSAVLTVGQRRFRAVLPALTGNLSFVETVTPPKVPPATKK
jgi:hypothetical protein